MAQKINKAGEIIKQIEMATVFDSREINAIYVNNVGVQIEYTDFSKDGSQRKVTEISYEDFCAKIEKHICDLIVD
ncbi:hypothetical protein [Enterococcus gallinarum]|uniref:Phage protein n=1 Tax=Enterococcus gallinarum TaxID=1353 RepID=A0ABD4ZXS2_ENTGA|nr:hypothetical protein [Enterococcus gallinarum]MBX8978113.1 hypothetical protein [Enterococcus gallinarum]MCR1933083.1 hypothetical protein [Enterococcus gallinarum]MDL4876895.1 hypothetical protein [Enterococcus gallinarum]MDL4922452.1 hypothetical protein [Enterococcus gallinarum]MDL4937554.1 hypothetical protein [Enterococcus gallinarum]